MEAPLCATFETRRGKYVYDAVSNHILKVDADVHALLREFSGQAGAASALDALARERAMSELAEARGQEILTPPKFRATCFSQEDRLAVERDLPRLGPDHFTVSVTERCNFRCRYCLYSGGYEGHRPHSGRSMSADTLDAAVNWYFSHKDREEFALSFYGGEPLLELGLVARAVERARRAAGGRRVVFRMTSNLSLLNEESARFLVENDFRLLVSLDGPPALHDRYRVLPGGAPTFALTWKALGLLRKIHPEYYAKRVDFNTVMAPPVDLPALREFVGANPEFFAGKRISPNPLSDSPSNLPPELRMDNNRASYQAQVEEMAGLFRLNLLEGPDKFDPFLVGLFMLDSEVLHLRKIEPAGEVVVSAGACLPGRVKAFAGLDGDLRLCERVTAPYAFGNVFTGFDIPALQGFMDGYNGFMGQRCRGCWGVRLCRKCVVNFDENGALSRERLERFCANKLPSLLGKIRNYAEVLEEKPDAFAWLDTAPGPND